MSDAIRRTVFKNTSHRIRVYIMHVQKIITRTDHGFCITLAVPLDFAHAINAYLYVELGYYRQIKNTLYNRRFPSHLNLGLAASFSGQQLL